MTYRIIIKIFHFLLQSIRHRYANNFGECRFFCLREQAGEICVLSHSNNLEQNFKDLVYSAD